MTSVVLWCHRCHWRTVCGEADVVRRLRAVGAFRRAPHPPEELVLEMLAVRLPELSCDACGGKGLCRGEADDSAGDWQQAIVCEICRQPIDPDRLEMFPAARRCVRCQDAAERNALPTPAEYCPRCGSLLELRVSRGGGLTRYKLFCTGNPPCRSVS